MEMDAREPTSCAPDLAELDLYCDRVASAVGRLSVRIFGDASPGGRPRRACARAARLQLTNILRDLVEDAERGRLYLPRELLDAPRHRRSRRRRSCSRIRAIAGVCAESPTWPSGNTPRHARRWRNARAARCGRRAVMGAVYRATLDAAAQARLDPARRAGLGAEAGEALARAAPRPVVSRPRRVHVIGAGMAGLAAAVRLADAGIAVVAARGGAAGGRALPLLFRCDARLPHRQRQSSAARRQPRGDGAISRRSARAIR